MIETMLEYQKVKRLDRFRKGMKFNLPKQFTIPRIDNLQTELTSLFDGRIVQSDIRNRIFRIEYTKIEGEYIVLLGEEIDDNRNHIRSGTGFSPFFVYPKGEPPYFECVQSFKYVEQFLVTNVEIWI